MTSQIILFFQKNTTIHPSKLTICSPPVKTNCMKLNCIFMCVFCGYLLEKTSHPISSQRMKNSLVGTDRSACCDMLCLKGFSFQTSLDVSCYDSLFHTYSLYSLFERSYPWTVLHSGQHDESHLITISYLTIAELATSIFSYLADNKAYVCIYTCIFINVRCTFHFF